MGSVCFLSMPISLQIYPRVKPYISYNITMQIIPPVAVCLVIGRNF